MRYSNPKIGHFQIERQRWRKVEKSIDVMSVDVSSLLFL
jgi:hypothetical protein